MGWQLFPTGIGWRSFDRTVEEGRFNCPNGRCKPSEDGTQRYRVRTGRNWATILFIPLIPLNRTGSYVQCRGCKSFLPLTAIDRAAPTSSQNGASATANSDRAETDREVQYATDTWSSTQMDEVRSALTDAGVGFYLEGGALVVDKDHERTVDDVVAQATGDTVG